MYNLDMKNIVKNNVIEKIKMYKYNTLLTLIIFILFLLFGYSNSNIDYKVYMNEAEVNFAYGIYTYNNEQYIHIDDLTNVFKDNIYNDKVSGKLIITTYNNLKKIETNDVEYVIKVGNNKYCSLKRFMSELGYNIVVSNEKIYILNGEYVEGEILKNRTEVYDKTTGAILCLLEQGGKVNIYVDSNVKEQVGNTVNVEVVKNKKTYYGYVLKKNVQYEYEATDVQRSNQKIVLVKAESRLEQNTDAAYIDMVAINMYRLSGVNTLTKLDYTNNVPQTVEVLATINNGHKSSNYDPDIVTRMLNSQSNRELVIQQVVNIVQDLDGVNLEFSNFKTSDKENYTQFIKELAATLHRLNKKLVVSVPSAQYIDVEEVAKIADYVVLQQYFARTLASKTSGPISSIIYVENILKDIVSQGVDTNKIILEIPAYTILWTERKGTVINAEQYTMKTMKSYLIENDIQSKLDSASGQNYINYTKGITTYKMWLEDEYSIIEKTKLAKSYNLAGVSIYKSGMEEKTIYSSISNNLKK